VLPLRDSGEIESLQFFLRRYFFTVSAKQQLIVFSSFGTIASSML
jgi:hypothetical protein